MPGTQNRTEDVFAKYNAMSTEELQQILREDASKPEGQEETSTEALFYIMEVLAQRRRARNEGKTPAEALEAFRKYYAADVESSAAEREPVVRKKNSTTAGWVKRLVAAAAIVVLILSGSITARSFGFDLWGVIVRWTQETFHFGYVSNSGGLIEPKKDNALVFSGLRSALETYEVTARLVPTWIPDGYEEASVRTFDTPRQRQFFGNYQSGENTIKIWICDYLDAEPTQIEQSDGIIEVYEANGIEYYIIENNGELRAAWVKDSFECYILGHLSVGELKNMIDSIEKD